MAIAQDHGRRALLADPTNAVAHNVLAVVALAKGHEPSAARHAEEVLRLTRHHPGNAYVAGMVLGASGQWDRGIGIIRDTVRLNPYGPNHRHTLLSVDALRRDDVADALAEASFLDFPAYLYGPLLRGLCLDALGIEDQALAEIEAALALEPELLDRPVEVLSAAPDHSHRRRRAPRRTPGHGAPTGVPVSVRIRVGRSASGRRSPGGRVGRTWWTHRPSGSRPWTPRSRT